jgi:hypothetical protein
MNRNVEGLKFQFIGLTDFEDNYDSEDDMYCKWRDNYSSKNSSTKETTASTERTISDKTSGSIYNSEELNVKRDFRNTNFNTSSTKRNETRRGSLDSNKIFIDSSMDNNTVTSTRSPAYNSLLNTSEDGVNKGRDIFNQLSSTSLSSGSTNPMTLPIVKRVCDIAAGTTSQKFDQEESASNMMYGKPNIIGSNEY